jgi:hypothetical protein
MAFGTTIMHRERKVPIAKPHAPSTRGLPIGQRLWHSEACRYRIKVAEVIV